ncbi:MAG: CDP-glycerol glycerophosphotransferase family protein [Clostridia bacterium]|nr:CDP-glycerol glycerophosphotransferase family protein [Clostridia bacterium]
MGKIRKLFEYFVVGKGFNSIGKAIVRFFKSIPKGFKAFFVGIKTLWLKGWKQIDRIFGLIARTLVKHHTKIQKNKVFFFTQEFRYGCNPKYICEELLRQNLDIDIVWRINDKIKGGMPATVRKVKAGTFAFYKEIYSSNVVVANSYIFLDQSLFLKKKQTLIQTWHGSLGIKKFGKNDMKGSWRRRWASIETGKMSTYCITNSSFVSSSLRNTYWAKTPMLEYGHPRNDLFFDSNKEKREAFRKEFCNKKNLNDDVKFVMYAPTFRDSHDFKCYNVDFDRLVASLQSRFGGEWCVLLRYHPSLLKIYKKQSDPMKKYKAKMINVTEHIDMQELIAITDVAITDYSSWIYDFMLLRRPGFIFATDIDLYNNERGFCYPLETTPFPIARNNTELEKEIMSFDQNVYAERLEAFLEDKGCVEDGHASERVVELIKKITGAEPIPVDAEGEEEDLLVQKYREKIAEIPERNIYLKGEIKTEGRDILTEKTLFKKKRGVYKKKIFLRNDDVISLFDVITEHDGTTHRNDNFGYDLLSEESKEWFVPPIEPDDVSLICKESGIYQFVFDEAKNELTVTVEPKETVNFGDYYLEGNFSKNMQWNGVAKKPFELMQEEDHAVIRDVYMKAGGAFVVVAVPAGAKNYEKASFLNGHYLSESPYAAMNADNNLIVVKNSGIYDVSVDLYTSVITIVKKY